MPNQPAAPTAAAAAAPSTSGRTALEEQLVAQVKALTSQMNAMQQHMQQQQPAQPAPAPQRSLLPPGVKVPTPPEFRGDTRESLQVWLFQVRDYFDLMSITEDNTRIRVAGALLRDKAASWYRAVRSGELPEEFSVRTWDQFEQNLHDNFRPIDTVKLARDRLAGLAQAGPVRDFISEFRNTVIDIPRMSEDEKLDRFMRGLKPHLRREVDLKEPARLEDAIRIAEKLDAGNRAAGSQGSQPKSGYSYDNNSHGNDGPRPMDLGVMNRSGSPHKKGERLTEEEREKLMAEGRCFYCREQGHIRMDCPKRPKMGKK